VSANFARKPTRRAGRLLEVIRLASIGRQAVTAKTETTPLLCVDRVRDIELLDACPKDRRLRIRLELDLPEVGAWSGEVPILALDEEAAPRMESPRLGVTSTLPTNREFGKSRAYSRHLVSRGALKLTRFSP
jgi:hypothetical protein